MGERGALAPDRDRADATVLDVGCGTGRVTEHLARLVPAGRVLAIDASEEMVALARERLGERAEVWRCDVLELDLEEEVDVVFSTATLHWVEDHDALWPVLARALRPGGRLEASAGARATSSACARRSTRPRPPVAPELEGFSPWTFAGPEETEQRLLRRRLRGAPAAGSRSSPPTRRRPRRSCAPRSWRRTWSACPEPAREPFVAAVVRARAAAARLRAAERVRGAGVAAPPGPLSVRHCAANWRFRPPEQRLGDAHRAAGCPWTRSACACAAAART